MRSIYLVLAVLSFAIPLSMTPSMLKHPDNLLFVMNLAETV